MEKKSEGAIKDLIKSCRVGEKWTKHFFLLTQETTQRNELGYDSGHMWNSQLQDVVQDVAGFRGLER